MLSLILAGLQVVTIYLLMVVLLLPVGEIMDLYVAPKEASSQAELVATRLAYEFLRDGKFTASSGPVQVEHLLQATAASTAAEDEFQKEDVFGNIAVQSVGFEEGPSDPKVHIYLTRGSTRLIKSLPKEIEGVQVRAHRMGAISIRPEQAANATNQGNFFEHDGRICCGSSCAPTSENCSGTLGAIVRISGSDGLFLLSNNHVLAGCNHVPRNQPIMSPSSADGRPTISAPREVGRHEMIYELRSGDPNFVMPCDSDLALARVTQEEIISSWQGERTDGYDTPSSVSAPVAPMAVKKIGRTTALTRGTVEARVTSPMPVAYASKHFKGTVWFTDVWTVRATNGVFALPGDSGSLVVTDDGQTAVGLVFAANRNGEYAWIIPMPSVVNSFGGLQLVTGHGV